MEQGTRSAALTQTNSKSFTTKDEAQATLTTAPGEVATVEAQEGHVYIGSLKNGLRHGTGKMTRVNGATYEGEWHEGARHGTGRFSDGTGTVYEGQFQNDKRHGKGKIVWSDGRIYDGEWEDDQRHGHGNFTDASGNVYDGSFVRDALEGHGITHRVDGGSYEGEFVDGDRQGYGQFTGKDGDGQFVYQGNYVGNKRHGPGKMTRSDGRVIESIWEHGKEVTNAKDRWKFAGAEIRDGVAVSTMGATVRTVTGVGQTPSADLLKQTSALESLTVHRDEP